MMVLRGLLAVSLIWPSLAGAQEIPAFVTCPVYRDTDSGPKSGCWLADSPDSGLRYDVSLSPTKPDWNHAVLVEGRRAAGAPDRCGGVVLDPVRVSVLADRPCVRFMLPAEGFTGHRFHLPTRHIRPLYAPPPHFANLHVQRSFSIPFDFGNSFLIYQLGDYYLDQAVAYARASHARRIIITGWAATRPRRIDGVVLAEPAALARARALLIVRWMRGLGVPSDRLVVRTGLDPAPAPIAGADGLSAPSERRTDILIIPETVGP